MKKVMICHHNNRDNFFLQKSIISEYHDEFNIKPYLRDHSPC